MLSDLLCVEDVFNLSLNSSFKYRVKIGDVIIAHHITALCHLRASTVKIMKLKMSLNPHLIFFLEYRNTNNIKAVKNKIPVGSLKDGGIHSTIFVILLEAGPTLNNIGNKSNT